MEMRLIVAAAAALLAAAGGIAYAESSGSGGTLGACANADGRLRLDTGTGCLPSERVVELGTAAATRADERFYVAPNLLDFSTMLSLGTGAANLTRVVTAHIPAGDYAIAAQITFLNHSGDGTADCILVDGAGHTHGFAETALGVDAGFSRNATMTMDGALSVANDIELSLACWNTALDASPGTVLVRAADITTKTVDAASITQEVH